MYALIDCCVANDVAESLAKLSSSNIAVTVAPLANVKLVLAVIPPPSTIVMASSPSVNSILGVCKDVEPDTVVPAIVLVAVSYTHLTLPTIYSV